ncbi:hypothetical protein EJB05_51318 [Eragrostis curvula]|uniref:DNA mismatch repair proteins mutS family domain-containing protein n=1 Tax=Eragrostis curvula TaxID=38414 RepID=A0A5J9SVZ4_9POAL|nr:hypothetical protein EJB05_51318 [Eragrostis curvula]
MEEGAGGDGGGGGGGGGDRSSFVIGLIENRAKEVGVAAFDLRSASLHLSQYIETSCSYHNTKTLLHFYDPMVLIVPPNKTAADGMVGVSELVGKHYPANKKITMARGCFDDTKGSVMVKNLSARDPSALGLDTYCKQYYLCLAAASATIKWIESEKGLFITNHSLSVTFNGSFDHMNIDSTRARLLRANLLQPLKDIQTINARLDCLDELVSNEELFFGLTQSLRKFPKESDKVLCHFCFKPKKVTDEVLKPANGRKSQMLISDIIVLKTALDAIPFFSKVLKGAKSFLLHNIYQTVCENPKYESMRKRIGDVIDEDVVHSRAPFVACTQQCFAVKAGIDGLLDVARRSFCDTSEGKDFTLSYPRRTLLIGFPINLFRLLDMGRMFTAQALSLLREGVLVHLFAIHTTLLVGLIDEIREDIGILTLLAEVLCLLDMIVNSFAHTISTKPVDRYTRPEFTDEGPMAINAGRHPILESLHTDFVPNNIFLSEASNMVLVMGPNMSGKSTYLQQICLIVILAQIGCYVPAQFASIRVVDRIFTRIGNGDNVENNSSTFMTEMKETAFIMQNVSSKSLIVVDELGRATSSSDGLAIAWSCCEYLLSIKAYQNCGKLWVLPTLFGYDVGCVSQFIPWLILLSYTVFATHMEGLSELSAMYPNVKILHFEVDLRNDRLDFKFRLKDGVRRVPHYGLRLARVAGLPASVIDTATSITSQITEQEMARMDANSVEFQSLQMAYQVAQRLTCLKYSNQGDEYVREALQNLKESIAAGRLT